MLTSSQWLSTLFQTMHITTFNRKIGVAMKVRLYRLMFAGVLALSLLMAATSLTAYNVKAADTAADGKESVGEYVSDAVITTAVKAKILEQKGLSAIDIKVETNEGVVTLSGTTDNAELSKLAENTAMQVKGVKKVVNHLTTK